MRSKEKVTLKWSKKENDWITRFPEWDNRNGLITGRIMLGMISDFESRMKVDFREHLKSGGFDPDTFTMHVNAIIK